MKKPTYKELEKHIAELEKKNHVLKAGENKFRTIIENINVGIYRSTPGKKGKFLELNPSMIRLFGFKNKEELLSSSARSTYKSSFDREAFNRKIIKHGFVKNEEIVYLRKDKSTFIGNETAVSIKDKNGKVIYFDGIIEDISEKIKAEKKLKDAHDIIDKSQAVVFLWRNEEHCPVEYVSENVVFLLGYTAKDIVQQKVHYDHVIHPDDLQRVKNETNIRSNYLNENRFTRLPYRIIDKCGITKWVEDITCLRRNSNKDITHFQGIVLDISDRMKIEEDRDNLIHELNKALEEVKTLKGIIPICAHCKNIRNDEGFWQKVEIFVKNHSEAEFSHGICPKCIKYLYPELHDL